MRTYTVEGQIFFASAATFAESMDVLEPVEKIVINVSAAHFWDISAVSALDRVVSKALRRGHEDEAIGLNAASATMIESYGPPRQNGEAALAATNPHRA